jgi:hypothetical protein
MRREGTTMPAYANLGGKSNVKSYEFGDGFIRVTFKDGRTYVYDYPTTGKAMVDQMIILARAGQGLNSFVTRVVKSRYASKY